MKKLGLLLALALITVGSTAIPAAGFGTMVPRIEIFKPLGLGWEPMACGDSLSGVGDVRVKGFITWTGTNPAVMQTQFRYDVPREGPAIPANDWYTNAKSTLLPSQETLVYDTVQDLSPNHATHIFKVNNLSCTITATNLPAETEGHKSDRTSYTDPVESIRIDLVQYGTGLPIACDGSSFTAGRIVVRIWATNQATANLDFHVHHERAAPPFTGPDQDGDPASRRWWEQGVHDVRMVGGVETNVLSFVASANGEGVNTIHAMQQHAPGQHATELFCSFYNTTQ